MWALLMELLALGGLLSGIHWKVNLGVWLGPDISGWVGDEPTHAIQNPLCSL